MVFCIKRGCDVTDKRYGPVIQPFVGRRMIPDSQDGWQSAGVYSCYKDYLGIRTSEMQTIIECLKTNSRGILWQGQRSPTSLYTGLLVFYEGKMNFFDTVEKC